LPGVPRCPTKNLGLIGSAVLTFIGYKKKQTNKQTDKPNLYINIEKSTGVEPPPISDRVKSISTIPEKNSFRSLIWGMQRNIYKNSLYKIYLQVRRVLIFSL